MNPLYGGRDGNIKEFMNNYLNKPDGSVDGSWFTAVLYDLSKMQINLCDGILNDLLRRYFGEEDVMIPYDLEDRKKKFPLAFEELGDYMKDYIGRGHQRGG